MLLCEVNAMKETIDINKTLSLYKDIQRYISSGCAIPADLQKRWDALISEANEQKKRLSPDEIEERNNLMKKIISEMEE